MGSEAKPVLTMLRAKQVAAMTGLPIQSIYALVAAGKFPRQVALSANRVAWVEADVQAFLRARVEEANKQTNNPRGCRPPKAARDGARPARIQRRTKSTRADGRRSATRD